MKLKQAKNKLNWRKLSLRRVVVDRADKQMKQSWKNTLSRDARGVGNAHRGTGPRIVKVFDCCKFDVVIPYKTNFKHH
ncbi:hypothetical protein HanIR_Chr01g0009311 [Helianthus annuus]|nr:hypothetical protein HanIR_Chr01g0009311 [Helianthus annuus]